ncbi:unnamed protein product [Rotaria magnacalcarata]|uniref:Peptidase C1A papain C-terminal domain-containing protein n=1 Tax=Rotaria magnacalcarata TaxID=392030 RepID=A0A816QNM7_9BILA|nr:unnamed protein product [Rotaria magnacalcarata]
MTIKTYLINKINAQKHRLNGIIPSNRLPSKSNLCRAFRDNIVYTQKELPPKVDLRKDMTRVEDQSKIGSCAANALAGAYEYLTKKDNGRNTDVSRLFIYYNARAKNKRFGSVTDSGCSMTSAIEALEEFGTCLESMWAYEVSKVNTRPNDQAYQEAKNHTISEAFEVDINLFEMKSCLAQGYPFAFGLRLYSSFDKATETGLVPMPDVSAKTRKTHGCHALLAVGYSDRSKVFIVRNSWGEKWGENGYCYIPYEYMTNPEHCFDVWAIRKLTNTNFGQEYWDRNDTVNYQNILTYNNGYDDTDNNGEIQNVDEDENNAATNVSGNSYSMYTKNPYDNYQQQYPGGVFSGFQSNLGDNSCYQLNSGANQLDQQNWVNNQFGQQNWNPNQFNQPSQQSWDNNPAHQNYGENNTLAQLWSQNQFNQQYNSNNNQFTGGQYDQVSQQSWPPNQFQQVSHNNYQLGAPDQQHWNNSNMNQTNLENNTFGQEMWNNNQIIPQNQPQWSNTQYGQPYTDSNFRGDTFGNQYPGNYAGSTGNFSGFPPNNPSSGYYGSG